MEITIDYFKKYTSVITVQRDFRRNHWTSKTSEYSMTIRWPSEKRVALVKMSYQVDQEHKMQIENEFDKVSYEDRSSSSIWRTRYSTDYCLACSAEILETRTLKNSVVAGSPQYAKKAEVSHICSREEAEQRSYRIVFSGFSLEWKGESSQCANLRESTGSCRTWKVFART